MPNFLHYCSVDDVKAQLHALKFVNEDVNSTLTDKLTRQHISNTAAAINAALKSGPSESDPVVNTVTTTTANAITATDVAQSFGVVSGANFAAGGMIRIHGISTDKYNDEFVGLVNVAGNTLTPEWIEHNYDAGAIVEACENDFLRLRTCNSIGAAGYLLLGLTVAQANSENVNVNKYIDEFNSCIDMIRSGTFLQSQTDEFVGPTAVDSRWSDGGERTIRFSMDDNQW